MSTLNRMQQHWVETRQFIRKEWPNISDTALRSINGDFDRFLEKLKETTNNFPLEEAKARNKIQVFLNSLE